MAIADTLDSMGNWKFPRFIGDRGNRLDLLVIVFLLFGCYGCVVPIDREIPELQEDVIVIEGFIDDDFGPHEIQVSALTPFASVAEGGGTRRLDAKVVIFSEDGEAIELERERGIREDLVSATRIGGSPISENCPPQSRSCGYACVGEVNFTTNYLTPSTFRGEPGKSYSIEVILDNSDKKYRSDFQTIPESTEIEDVFFVSESIPSNNDLVNITGVNVYATWQDPPSMDNFYLWNMEGTYRIETPCREPVRADPSDVCLYDPRDNFGEACWIIERNVLGNSLPVSDRLFNGTSTTHLIGFLEDDSKRFSSDFVSGAKQYHGNVIQYTVNKEAFEFYSEVEILSEINGEIFDTAPVTPIGNIYNVADPSEPVIGFFGAFAKSEKGAFVNRNVLQERKKHGQCGDCRYLQFQGQLEVPEVYR